VQERGGYDLFSDMGYKPTNKYLPPRARRDKVTFAEAMPKNSGSAMDKLFAWADKLLTTSSGGSTATQPDNSSMLEG
jgi:hypothetical protein